MKNMKKKLIILLLVFALLPTRVLAGGLDSYQENDKQAVIYMFRGQGCGYCRAFLSFLASITEEYGEYFKLVSFEVWNDATNSELFHTVAKAKGTSTEQLGVPYILIGDKVFGGYDTTGSGDAEIKEAIMAQYKDPKYDVMDDLKIDVSKYKTMNLLDTLASEGLPEEGQNEADTTSSSSGSSNTFAVIFWNALFVAAGAGAVVYFSNKNTQKVLDAIKKEDKKETKKK